MAEEDIPENPWPEIYELEAWNEKARAMIMENTARIAFLKNNSNKENDNGSQG